MGLGVSSASGSVGTCFPFDSLELPGVVAHAYHSRTGETEMGISLRLAGQAVLPTWLG